MAAPAEATSQPQENGTNGTNIPSSNANGFTDTTATVAPGLSADEMAQYDRQIRLWGAEAQGRIRAAKVLLISLRALGTEIAKNLTLAGISELTIVDDELVTEDDLGAQFFIREEDVGKKRAEAALPRIQELNPRVTVKADGGLQDLLIKDQNYYVPFDCIIACDHDIMTLSLINTAARFASRPFYAAGIHGFYGYIFADLVGHEFIIERAKSNLDTAITVETLTRSVVSVTLKKESDGKTTEIVKKAEIYCPLILANSSPLPMDVLGNRRKMKAVSPLLPCLRALFEFQRESAHLPAANPQDLTRFAELAKQKTAELGLPPETLNANFLRSFLQNVGAEITPTAAFVGGRLSEDVINVIGKREQPIQNFALFDGDALDGRIYCLYSIPPELQLGFDPNLPMPPLDMTGDMAGFNGLTADMSLNGMAQMQMPTDMTGDINMLQNMPMDMNGTAPAGDSTATNGNANANANGHPEQQQPPTQQQPS